jgi:hypothetical protein
MMPRRFSPLCVGLVLLAVMSVMGCHSEYGHLPDYHPSTQPIATNGLSNPTPFEPADAVVVPPVGWVADELKSDHRYAHQVWKSPSGSTCYGIIHFGLPLPVPASFVIKSYLEEMKQSEGQADVQGQMQNDDALPGIRFTVDCGDYRMRTNFICKGFGGWAVYVGTLRDRPEVPAEIELAERAREKTKIGLPSATGNPAGGFIRPTAVASE